MEVITATMAIVILGLSAVVLTGFVAGMAMAAVGKLREWQQRQVDRGAGLESPGETAGEE